MAKKKPGRKKGGVNKSAAIREYLTANKDAPAKEVVAALGEKKIKVSEGLVNNVKSNLKAMSPTGKRRRGKVTTGRRTAAAASNGHFAVEELVAAKKLVDRLGGADRAKEALSAIEKISA